MIPEPAYRPPFMPTGVFSAHYAGDLPSNAASYLSGISCFPLPGRFGAFTLWNVHASDTHFKRAASNVIEAAPSV